MIVAHFHDQGKELVYRFSYMTIIPSTIKLSWGGILSLHWYQQCFWSGPTCPPAL